MMKNPHQVSQCLFNSYFLATGTTATKSKEAGIWYFKTQQSRTVGLSLKVRWDEQLLDQRRRCGGGLGYPWRLHPPAATGWPPSKILDSPRIRRATSLHQFLTQNKRSWARGIWADEERQREAKKRSIRRGVALEMEANSFQIGWRYLPVFPWVLLQPVQTLCWKPRHFLQYAKFYAKWKWKAPQSRLTLVFDDLVEDSEQALCVAERLWDKST